MQNCQSGPAGLCGHLRERQAVPPLSMVQVWATQGANAGNPGGTSEPETPSRVDAIPIGAGLTLWQHYCAGAPRRERYLGLVQEGFWGPHRRCTWAGFQPLPAVCPAPSCGPRRTVNLLRARSRARLIFLAPQWLQVFECQVQPQSGHVYGPPNTSAR